MAAKSSSFSLRRNPFSQREGETIVSAPGSLQGADISIDSLKDCDLFVLDHTAAIYVDQCVRCRIRLGPVAGFCYVRNCSECIFSVACQQLRAKECEGLTVFLYSATDPHIEMCKDITLAPYNFAYPLQDQHFKKAGLDPIANLWSQVYDHTPSNTEARNWELLAPEEFEELRYEIPEMGEPIDPVPKHSSYGSPDMKGVIVVGSQVHNKFKQKTPRGNEDFEPEIIQEEEDQGKMSDVEFSVPKVSQRQEPSRLSNRSPRGFPISAPAVDPPVANKPQSTLGSDILKVRIHYTKPQEFDYQITDPDLDVPLELLGKTLRRASELASPYQERLRMFIISAFCVLLTGFLILLSLILILVFVDLYDAGLAFQLFFLIVSMVGLLIYIGVQIRKTRTKGNLEFRKAMEEETGTTYNQYGLVLTGNLDTVEIAARPKTSLQAFLR